LSISRYFAKKIKMGWIDILLASALGYAAYKGFRNGFFVELASLFSLLLGVFIALKFSFYTREFLEKLVKWNPVFIQIVAFALTFILVLVAIHFLVKSITKIARFAALGWLNTIGGAVLSVLKMMLTLSVLLNLMAKINVNNYFLSKETIQKSALYLPIQEVAKAIYPNLNDWYKEIKS
jgi:membrane protein required for colicin V production